ncbi:GUN4 domain-containing protein [Nostoc sp.]
MSDRAYKLSRCTKIFTVIAFALDVSEGYEVKSFRFSTRRKRERSIRNDNELWLKYSNRYFGFSLQKQIWLNLNRDWIK